MEFRDLGTQYSALKEQIDEVVLATISANRFIGGTPVTELERRLAEYVGVRHCITCANGTDALQLALMAWGVGPGDAVFVPDFTFFSTGEVVSAVGATPVFVDVHADTFNIDLVSLQNAYDYVSSHTDLTPKAVVPVDLFGQPADWKKLLPLCKRLGLLTLEDGAQGFGGAIGTQRACSFGSIATTSFFPAKPLGCYGDGGAIFTNDDEWDELLRSYAVHGKGAMKYDNVRVGMNSRLDTIQAAILNVKLAAFASYELAAVNERAEWYSHHLSNSGVVLPKVLEGFCSSWAQYSILLPKDADRARLQKHLGEQGIPSMVYYPKPMHEQTAFKGTCLCPDGCPVTTQICKTVLSLPMGPYLSSLDCERTSTALMSYLS